MPDDTKGCLENRVRVSDRTLQALKAAKTGNHESYNDVIAEALRGADLSRPDPAEVLEGGAT
jgi:hypothetical protein